MGGGASSAQNSVPIWSWDDPTTASLRWLDLATGSETGTTTVDSVVAFFPTLGAGNVAVVDGTQPRVLRDRAYAVAPGADPATAPSILVFGPEGGPSDQWAVPDDLAAGWAGAFVHVTPVTGTERVAAVIRVPPSDDGTPHPKNGTAVLYEPSGAAVSVVVYDSDDGIALPPFFSADGTSSFTLTSTSGSGAGFRMTALDSGAPTALECQMPWAASGRVLFLDGAAGHALLAAYDAGGAVRYSVCDVASGEEVLSVAAPVSSSYAAGPYEALDSAYLTSDGRHVVAWPFATGQPAGERSTGDVLVYDVSTGGIGAWYVLGDGAQPLLSDRGNRYVPVTAERGEGAVESISPAGAAIDVDAAMPAEEMLGALAGATDRALPPAAAARADSLIGVAVDNDDPAVRGAALWEVEQAVDASAASLSRAYSDLLRATVPLLVETYGPPTNEAADVRPIIECTSVGADGVQTVYFGYENAHGSAVRIPVGPRNRLAPVELDRLQATVFAMPDTVAGWTGRSPYFPDYAFRVEAADATWSLGGGQAGTLDGPPSCDRYLPDWQAIETLPAAVVVDGPVSASFRGSSFGVRGAAHNAGGQPTSDPAVRGIVASTPEAATTVRSSLASSQADRVSGQDIAPDVTDGLLRFPGATWAAELAGRAEVTLDAQPSDSVGSLESPLVAHAPTGVMLSGGFRGYGVLVVDGAFEMRGDAEWTGLVIVRGTATQEAAPDVVGSARIIGGLVLVGTDGASAALSLAGRASVLHSPDALALARRAALGQ